VITLIHSNFADDLMIIPVPDIHITDFFFHAEISQAMGSEAGDAWLTDQRSVGPRKPTIAPKLANPKAKSIPRCSKASGDRRSSQGRSSTWSCQIEIPPTKQLESERAYALHFLGKELRLDNDLLCSDAAQTVLRRLGRSNSI
jgi:hypothetical protein